MISTKQLIRRTLIWLLSFYIVVCLVLYFFQEKFIFFPDKLQLGYRYEFDQPFEELTITATDGKKLNALLFTVQNSKGLIFYLHGNAGALDSWGSVASTYTDLGYDVFILDYRGYGKSEGKIKNQTQFFEDIQAAYDTVKRRYEEDKIIVLGYSIGTGAAAYTAAQNRPKMLILQAPYYSLTDVMKHHYRIIPTFLLKYKFETHQYIKNVQAPIVLFHGNRDEVIYYGSSLKLKAHLKPTDTLVTLHEQGHNGMTENPQYIQALKGFLD